MRRLSRYDLATLPGSGRTAFVMQKPSRMEYVLAHFGPDRVNELLEIDKVKNPGTYARMVLENPERRKEFIQNLQDIFCFAWSDRNGGEYPTEKILEAYV